MSVRPFRLYNSMTRRTEALQPIEPGHLRFYTCGPTVYSHAHVGNFRSFLTADLILRTARVIGWKTTYVTNVTDVGHLTEDDVADAGGEDRMVKALRSERGERYANIWDLARYYTQAMLSDWRALNLLEPDVRPRATDHVTAQIRAIEQLVRKGHAYETAQGVYFEVRTFPAYGRLSGNTNSERLEGGARPLVLDPEKRDPRDFALWKKDPNHLMTWYSPWGWGFPGWHVECSTMAQIYLGDSFDLHTGGEDNRFPHHECEIAQAECLTGKPFARHWVHTRFLQVEGEKMSKSAGNFFTVRELIAPATGEERRIRALTLRLALISGQYRKPFNFTFDLLRAATKHVQRFGQAANLAERALAVGGSGNDLPGERLDALYAQVLEAMLDDLNTPAAIAASIEGTRLILGFGNDLSAASARAAKAWLTKINDLLGIAFHDAPHDALHGLRDTPAREAQSEALSKQVEALLHERTEARKQRDFKRADEIRDHLEAMNVEVMDAPDGTRWRHKVPPPLP